MIKDRIIRSEKIDWQNIKTLQPDNFKIPEQQEVLKKSIVGNGFVSPFCVWEDAEGVIWSIDGVHRIKALKELQEQKEDIPKLLTANFIDAKTRKEAGIILLEVFNTKQNKATEDGLELLKIDLNICEDDLHVDVADLDLKLDELLDAEVLPLEEADEEAPTPPVAPKTVKGDLYELNGHRVLCGDSTMIDDVDKLMQGEKADLVFTDPMYDDSTAEFLSNISLISDNYLIMCTLKQGFSMYNDSGWEFNFDIVLNQKIPSSMLNKRVPYYLHKNILYFSKNNNVDSIFNCDNAKNIFSDSGKGYYPSVIESAKQTNNEHGLAKNPEGIIKILSGFKARLIADIFLGSGSTLIACEQTNRKCYGLELEERYCDVVVTRWVNMMEQNKKEYSVKLNGEIINWKDLH